ncbi:MULTISPECIES: IclR family transcriptional regulator [unclassified Streptomyces]|uniref:IclR family transcriptional regulator n=1 Tax=unclassified Streptomyces TaxID=2593676 RepID=UPI002255BBBB|nr:MULTISPECIES: IclR family transcriptional regulator [unclassified Streptomyces]MCX4409957.1 IclR family transcriptional regulator [Streptomyces sp. NBC_01764]MCX5191728.1 IclR family transcriptional regulator [Streptomyces sp. NBC_00268]
MPRSGQPGRSVSSRLFDVLFAFRPGRSRLTLADLTRQTGLPHATVRRLALELVEAGLLDRAPDGGFTVGIQLWQLGTLAPLSVPLRTAALPFMDDLHTALRQHVQLAVLEGTEAVLVERLSADKAVDVMSRLGGRLPLHCSGVGKVLLAHAGPELVEQVVAQGLPAYTERTVTDPARLRSMLAECRETGVAVVREETTLGVDSVATRILNADGEVVAALSVVVGAGSVDLRAIRPAVIASGLAVSRRLGWHPPAGVR